MRRKPHHPQIQGLAERANGDIKEMLTAWLHDNSTADWNFRIKFVQFSKNSVYCAAIKRSPYEALFGTRTKVGLTSTSLPSEVIERLQSEEDLLVACSSDAESVSPDNEQESMVDDVMSTPLLLSIEETPPSPPLLTPIQLGPDETFTAVPEVTPQASLLDTRQNMIHSQQVGDRVSQCAQAEWMIKRRRLQLPSVDKGDTVALSTPQVDRGRGDPRNILWLVMDHDLDTDLY